MEAEVIGFKAHDMQEEYLHGRCILESFCRRQQMPAILVSTKLTTANKLAGFLKVPGVVSLEKTRRFLSFQGTTFLRRPGWWTASRPDVRVFERGRL